MKRAGKWEIWTGKKGQATERQGQEEVKREQVKFRKEGKELYKGKGARTGRNRKKLKEWSRSGKTRAGTERNRAGKGRNEIGMDRRKVAEIGKNGWGMTGTMQS